jgi:phosphoribosyl-AMP cyclohydrolase / phosphoribosyl-ATP pyrophosphohydrolase
MSETADLSALRWDEQGLLPAVVQDAHSRAVLMVAWMNAEALRLTLETGETHFWSRSRGKLWHKGETSGNRQQVTALSADCDCDTLLVQVEPLGPACHTGAVSCFFRSLGSAAPADLETTPAVTETLRQLWETIESRKQRPPPGSYTAKLFDAGLPRIAQKVGEEAVETIVAAMSEGDERLLSEMADLIYHCMVLLSARALDWADLEAELGRRFK